MKKTMALVFFLSFFLCRIFPFGEIRVPADHVKINDAVQAASWGQTVQIDPGVYDGSTQDFPIFMKDGVSVEGAGTALTIIDNGGTGVPAIFAENMLTSASLMRSFTVRGGYLSAGSGAAMIIRNTVVLFITDVRFTGNSAPGAGAISIENANAYFRDCRFERNQGGSGGAISISGSSAPLFINCDFENNQAFASGGAIFVGTGANMEVNRSRFLDNLAGINGGAVYILSGGGALLDNVIQGNSASLGGGVYLGSPASSATIQRCVIRKNSALEGGGVYSAGGGIAIMANTISHNTAISNGAAYQASGATDDFLNNTIHHNICDGASGSTLLIQSSSMNAVNNTIAHNDCAQAVRLVNASPSIFNNIIAFNTGAGLFESGAASDPDCQYNLIHANPAGNYVDEGSIILNTAAEINSALNAPRTSQMNITGDPLFRDALAGDYHIRSSSPAREAATWLPPSFPEEDMDSDIRRDARCGTLPDAGADEFSAPVLVPPALYYDVNGDDEVTTGDLLVLTFSRPVDSPTTITAADFSLPVAFDTLGTNPRVIISPLNARQTIITLGGSPYLTVDDIYSDSAKDPGYPSGIDVAPPRPDGIQDEEGVPASPLGPPAGDPTGLDITRSIMTNSGYTSWYIGTIILAGAGSVFPATQLEIPLLSSYYEGSIIIRRPRDFFGAINAVAFDASFPQFVFPTTNPAVLTIQYSENELDPASGQREENLRIFRLNRLQIGQAFFELVPDVLGHPQNVDTLNNTVSVRIDHLFMPRTSTWNSPVKIPVTGFINDNSKAIYAVFHVDPFIGTSTIVRAGAPGDAVTLSPESGSVYALHEAVIRGFAEDPAGDTILRLRPARSGERDLLPGSSNAIFAIEAFETDGITPVDITETATLTVQYMDRSATLFDGDLVNPAGLKGSEPQMRVYAQIPPLFDSQPMDNYVQNAANNTLTVFAAPSRFVSGRAILGAAVDYRIPFAWDFRHSEDAWTYFSDFTVFDAGIPGSGPGFLAITCKTDNTFSFWQSDPDELPAMEGYVYQARIPVDTSIHSQSQCPSFRIRMNSQNGQMSPSLHIMSYEGGLASPSALYPKTCDMFFKPPASAVNTIPENDDLQFSFDLINLDPQDYPDTTVFFRGVQIARIPEEDFVVSDTLAVYNFTTDSENWGYINAAPFFTAAQHSVLNRALHLGVVNSNTFGSWELKSDIAITTNTLYRARFFIFSDILDQQETPDVRLRMGVSSFMDNALLNISNSGGAQMSPVYAVPREYVVYFMPQDELLRSYTPQNLYLAFDLINLSSKGRSGTGIFLDRVILESLVPPPWPQP